MSFIFIKGFSTLIIIRNYSWAVNQHIRMISEGSCDPEDWSNDAENSALHHRNKIHFKIFSNSKQLFHNNTLFFLYIYWFYFIFDQINAVLLRELRIKFVNNMKKNLTDPKLLNSSVTVSRIVSFHFLSYFLQMCLLSASSTIQS